MHLLSELLAGWEGAEVSGHSDVLIARVMADSRRVEPQDLFVAVRGTVIDGHDMVSQAVERGATVIIGERHLADVSFDHGRVGHNVTYVRVPNTRLLHAHLLRISRPEVQQALDAVTFIGVTGTNGKTTVATVLEQCLLHLGVQAGFLGTTGYRYGSEVIAATHTTPDVERLYELIVQMHQHGVTHIVMEVSSHALDQERINGIPFSVAVFTNLTRDHLDYHESMEDYAAAKQKLFNDLSPDSIAVLNGDDNWCAYMKRTTPSRNIWTVGRGLSNRARVADVQMDMTGSTFTVDGLDVRTPLVGAFNVVNVSLCAVVLRAMSFNDGGMRFNDDSVRSALTHARGAEGRMEQHKLATDVLAIIDYAHTPDALEKVIRAARPLLTGKGRLHVVFGCGGDRDKGKRPEMGRVAAAEADEVWVTSDNPRHENPASIIDDILAGIPAQIAGSSAVHVIEDRREAIVKALRSAVGGDIVIVAGKGHEKYQIIGDEKIPFSDADVVASQ